MISQTASPALLSPKQPLCLLGDLLVECNSLTERRAAVSRGNQVENVKSKYFKTFFI